MKEQPEALRLADALITLFPSREDGEQAAAELRRLHTENERLHQINQSHEMKLSVRGYEIQIADLEAQRDALLEALRGLLSYANVLEMRLLDADGEHRAMQQARAAIAKAEGENHAKNL